MLTHILSCISVSSYLSSLFKDIIHPYVDFTTPILYNLAPENPLPAAHRGEVAYLSSTAMWLNTWLLWRISTFSTPSY